MDLGKIVLVLCVLNLIYIPAAFMVHPNVSQVVRGVIPNLPGGLSGGLFFILMANIGTTIAPWMLFFQQSSVVDKGMKEKDIPFGKMDTAVGAILTVVVAVFVIVVTGTLLYGQTQLSSAAQAAVALRGINYWVGTFLAIGLFDAGLLGAIAISLASSWAIGEVFGWAHSLNHKVREAPWFYVAYFFLLISAGTVTLIMSEAVQVQITLFVQVIAVTLLPAALVFLLLLLNSEELVGKYKNTRAQNIIGVSIVAMIILFSTLYAVSALFGGI